METTDLHARLDRLAERTAPAPRDAAHLVRTVAARSRAQRRQRLGIGAVALAVAAVVAAVPVVLSWRATAPSPAAPTTVPTAVTSGDVLTGPTRGSLAGDAVFVESVRQLPWTVADDPDAPTAQAEPAPESRRVVFAGDVPGGRWAAVAAADVMGAQGLDVMWFVGPPGAAADQLQPAQLSGGLAAGRPVALMDAGTGTLVVVAAPGDTVEVSERPDVAADATVSRDWEPVDVEDGVAVTAVTPVETQTDEAVRYRVTRDGAEVVTALPPGFRAGDHVPPAPTMTWLRGSADPSVDVVLVGTAMDTLTRIGLSPADVPFSVVWSDDVPGPDGPGTRLSLLTATLPSGATYTEARLTRAGLDGVQAGALCGSEPRPAGTPLLEQTFAVRCDGIGLVVVAPPAAVRARLLEDSGRTVAEYDLDGGVAVVSPPPDGATVQTLAADGSSLAEVPVMGSIDLSRK
jgi:hypothetical protein